jgi:hypothetical protein
MVRPIKPDHDAIALTTVRVSAETKRLLQDLKQKHGFTTADEGLRYYLPSNVNDNSPMFHAARDIYNLTIENRA